MTYQEAVPTTRTTMSPTLVRHERRQARLRALALLAQRREQARTRQEQPARR